MPLLARLHPLLVHFPIALVVIAALAEAAAALRRDRRLRVVAIANVRAGAVFALLAALAGWRLAAAQGMEATSLLEWHRWLGASSAAVAVAAALASFGRDVRSCVQLWIYRITLFAAAALVAVTGHFGGLLVWGTHFFHFP
jgi:uncharacterized membrane protein